MGQNKWSIVRECERRVAWVPMSRLLVISLSLCLTLATLDARAQEGSRTLKLAVPAATDNNRLPTKHIVQTQSGRISYLKAPTLIVWGTDDVYFDVKWSHWLADNIPGARCRVEFKGARLFFPEERSEDFNQELRAHWQIAQHKQPNKEPALVGVTPRVKL